MRKIVTTFIAASMAAVIFSWPGINAVFAADGRGAVAAVKAGTPTFTIADMEGKPIAGIEVKVTDGAGGEVFAGASGKDGQFKVPDLEPGSYTLAVDGKYSFPFEVVEKGGDKALWIVVPREGLAAAGEFVKVGSNLIWVGLGAAAVIVPIVLIGSTTTDCK